MVCLACRIPHALPEERAKDTRAVDKSSVHYRNPLEGHVPPTTRGGKQWRGLLREQAHMSSEASWLHTQAGGSKPKGWDTRPVAVWA